MPWFFELDDFIRQSSSATSINMKGLYLWALGATLPPKYSGGSYMVVVNRRRIWSVCAQIAHLYLPRVSYADLQVHEDIRAVSTHRDVATFMPDFPFNTEMTRSFWINSWDEIQTTQTVQTLWSSEGYFVGIPIAPKGQRRPFGVGDVAANCRIESFDLESGIWVDAITLHIPRENGVGQKHRLTFPTGITVSLKLQCLIRW
jgi:hypothetical protein